MLVAHKHSLLVSAQPTGCPQEPQVKQWTSWSNAASAHNWLWQRTRQTFADHLKATTELVCTETQLATGAGASRRVAIAQLATAAAAGIFSPAAAASSTNAESSCRIPAMAALQVDYDKFAGTYDQLDDGSLSKALGFQDLRQQLLAAASGEVLEVAVGTGINLPLYNWPAVQQLTAVDLSQGMLDQAAARMQSLLQGRPITLRQASVEALPFPAASFDCIVDTFSLCVFPRPQVALTELARVLRPGGRLLLLEHSRSSSALLAAYQDATNSAVAAMSKGCAWNQDVPLLLAAAGLRPVQLQRFLAGTVVLLQAELA